MEGTEFRLVPAVIAAGGMVLPGTTAINAEGWAAIHGVQLGTVKEWIVKRRIPHRNIGGTWWIEPTDLLATFPKSRRKDR